MATIHPHAYLHGKIIPIAEANVSIASSAVLYGLSVYTVLPIIHTTQGLHAFRLKDHEERLRNSARIIGIDTSLVKEGFLLPIITAVTEANELSEDTFIRVSLHVTDLVPGVRTRGLATTVSAFGYSAPCILPPEGARLKTSMWRRVPDNAIPSRAKVNGAYVNSVLGKQDALDAGYDDCIFLDEAGHVCELSAANIFLIRKGQLITPSSASDVLEGITRRSIITIAMDAGIPVVERPVDLTELYIADEVFACGTSANLTPVLAIDGRDVAPGKHTRTNQLKDIYARAVRGEAPEYKDWVTAL